MATVHEHQGSTLGKSARLTAKLDVLVVELCAFAKMETEEHCNCAGSGLCSRDGSFAVSAKKLNGP